MTTASDYVSLTAPPLAAPVSRARRWNDYYELSKPRMNLLILATTAVGYFMASRGGVDWPHFLHGLLGTALTAASAAMLNQYIERDYDLLMKRTANRPLPAGRIPAIEALLLGVVLGIVGLCDLAYFVNSLTATLGAITLGSYVFFYTPLKRWTTVCTIVGAIPGALPPAMGVTAARGEITAGALALFGILFFWQMPHFLAIAILYRDDYAKGGFKMLPVIDPELRITSFQIVLWSLVLIPVSLLPYAFGLAGPIYFVSAMVLGMIFTAFGVICAIKRGRREARQLFLASIVYLPFLLGSMMIDKI